MFRHSCSRVFLREILFGLDAAAASSRSRTRRKQAASSNPSLDIEEHPPHTPKTLTVDQRLHQKTNAP